MRQVQLLQADVRDKQGQLTAALGQSEVWQQTVQTLRVKLADQASHASEVDALQAQVTGVMHVHTEKLDSCEFFQHKE